MARRGVFGSVMAALALASTTRQMIEGGGDPTFIKAAFGQRSGSGFGGRVSGMHVPRPRNQRQKRRDRRRTGYR